jgi:hypothetical protein
LRRNTRPKNKPQNKCKKKEAHTHTHTHTSEQAIYFHGFLGIGVALNHKPNPFSLPDLEN